MEEKKCSLRDSPIAATESELIYYPIFIAEDAFITTQGKDVALGGADGMISPDFLEAAGEAAEGVYHSGPDLTFDNPLAQAFLRLRALIQPLI